MPCERQPELQNRVQKIRAGTPRGIAGIWSVWKSPEGERAFSYSMLTVNADDHPFMNRYHKPGDEKRMVVILDEADYGAWLSARPSHAREFLRQFPAENLSAAA